MKTKHLFYSLALASTFAACTQEELVEAPVAENNLASRPVAGVVEFTTGGVESRYNYEWNNYQVGDIFGLYLMDNFNPNGQAKAVNAQKNFIEEYHGAEHWDANTTYWKYQNHWFGMYDFTNNIQSNYPFRAVKEGDKFVWKNDAKLVEGNYFAMFPQNSKALNRRELWHAIKPAVELKPVADKTLNPQGNMYQYVENQLWLGYKQIYRDATASAEGVMKMDVNMKAVLVPLKFTLSNLSDCDVILDKIVVKNKSGKALPTLAYIEPVGYERTLADADKLTHQVVEGWVVADKSVAEPYACGTKYKAYGLFDEAKTWTKQTIQHLVDWTVPGEKGIPYGLDAADKTNAYEYSFAFPANTVVEGDVNGGDIVKVFVALPAVDSETDLNDLTVLIYGWEQKNSGNTYGYLVQKAGQTTGTSDNYSFELSKYLSWAEIAEEEGGNYREILVEFDDFSWKPASEEILAASTEDMEKNVMSVLAKATSEPVQITVKPDVTGVEVKASFLEDLKKYSAKNTRKVEITFDGTRGGSVKFYDDNTLIDKVITTEVADYVDFKYSNITLKNYAEQTLTNGAEIEQTATIHNEGTGKLNVLNGSLGQAKILGTVNNRGAMLVNGGNVTNIDNSYALTLKGSANVTETLNNGGDAVINVEGNATVKTLNNIGNHECSTCERPTLNVKAGTLTVTDLINGNNSNGKQGAIMSVSAGANVKVIKTLTNGTHVDYVNGVPVQKVEFVNNGNIYTETNGIVGNGGILNNYGTVSAAIENKGDVYAWAGKIEDLKNTIHGELHAMSEDVEVIMNQNSEGAIVYTGVVAQFVQKNNGDDVAIFRTVEDMEIIDLIEKMVNTGSKTLYIGDNLNLAYDNTDANLVAVVKKFRNFVEAVVVEGNINWTGALNGSYSAFQNAALSVNDDCTMYVKGMIKVFVESLTFNDTDNQAGTDGAVWVGDGATLTIGSVDFTNKKITSANVTQVGGSTTSGNSNSGTMN